MKTAQDWLYCISGALLFSFSMNVFLVPLHIYSAGFLGIAQLLRDLLLHILPYRLSFDIAGIINLILNIFMIILAARGWRKHLPCIRQSSYCLNLCFCL